jgi:hypothetical protein
MADDELRDFVHSINARVMALHAFAGAVIASHPSPQALRMAWDEHSSALPAAIFSAQIQHGAQSADRSRVEAAFAEITQRICARTGHTPR